MPTSGGYFKQIAAASLGLAALLLGTFSPIAAWAAQDVSSGVLTQIVPGNYAFMSGDSVYGYRVSGIIATNEGAVVVDALTDEAMAKRERALIASVIKQPVRYLVSSTFHDNYTGGNVAYPDVIKIGHENYKTDLIELMKRRKLSAAEQAARLPQLTYRDKMTLNLGGKEIQILFVGRGHTRGDSIVFVPQDRVVYMSELFFYERFPWMITGYINWINAIDAALKLDADYFVAGQGSEDMLASGFPPNSRQALVRFRQILVDARDAVQKEIDQGFTEDQTAAKVLLSQYKGLEEYDDQRETVVRRTYQDLKGMLP